MKGKKADINLIVWIVIAVVILATLLGLLIKANAQARGLKYRACEGGAGLGLPNFEGICREKCEGGEIGLGQGTLEEPKNGCPKEDNPETDDDESKMIECCIKKS